ncbi:MAG TPA: enoyl-CoA hydratase-related protein [Chloroflexota bacterium]|nr:enoyl-CoA hydratase-related protein [Chloroflexota bacterium]
MIRAERRDGRLLQVTLDRPEKRNALTLPMLLLLTRELQQADSDEAIRGVVLAGAGPSFSAGVDLNEFANGSPDTARTLIVALKELCATVRRLGKPVACAIQGHCLGGALELAACCDFRVCAPDARLGMPEVSVGIPSVIDAVMLGHLVGTGRARELLLTGEPISGETAYEWGLANRLASPAQVVPAAAELLALVTRHRPEVVAVQKRLHQEWLDVPYTHAVEHSTDFLVDAFRSGAPQRIAADRLRRH